MKKKILVVGCSFSHYLQNDDGSKENSWVDWMSQEFTNELYICNISLPGSSNELIKRMVTKKILQENWDYVIVQWSTIDRWDYPIQNQYFPDFVRYWPSGSNLEGIKSDFYNKYYSVYGAVADTLENILFTQQLLELENIPYNMITIGNLFTLSTTIEQIKNLINTKGDYYGLKENVLEKIEILENDWEDMNIIPFLIKKINYDKFTFTNGIKNPFGGGMLEWLYEEKKDYPKKDWHFSSEQSQQFFYEFIKPKILIKNGII
jgi:hypothetical protein